MQFCDCENTKETNPFDMRNNIYLLLLIFCCSEAVGQALVYPSIKKVEQTDTYFGTSVNDPYRWLEDDNSLETANWVRAENEVTFKYLAGIPFKDQVKARMKALWNYPRQSAPKWQSGSYYFYKNDGMQNQSPLFRSKGIKSKPEMILDPNFMSKNGTTSLKIYKVSNDGKYAAYAVSEAGSDWMEIHVMENETSRDMSEVLKWVKFSEIEWEKDGFYYSGYDEPSKSTALSGKNEYHKVYFHKVGTPQSNDQLIYEDKSHPLRNFGASVSTDEKYIYIATTESTSGNELVVREAGNNKNPYKTIAKGFENSWTVIDNNQNNIILLTNADAPKNKIVIYDFNTGTFTTIVPEQKDVILDVVRSSNKLVCHFMKDASSRLAVYSLIGVFEKDIKLPTYCTVSALNGSKEDSLLFYSISSFTFPETTFMFNMVTGNQNSYFKPAIDFNAAAFETKQLFYKSKDGTSVPMFLVMKKGTLLDGKNPLLLFGYGGFNISKTPEFNIERLVFLENGGIFAMPNLRGGGEYGEEWHEAGTKLHKQNVFDDFIAAAEYLIKEKYTNPNQLAIGGRSNGGLLVGAALTQRPDLFKVALPAVGVMDMLRFHKFTIGWAWTGDYGSSDNKEQFEALFAYSPLHNIRKGVHYPATLVTTADHDDRVVPAHSFKFISTLQEKGEGNNPLLIRIDVDAGHGSGKPVSKLIDEQSDIFSFMMYNLGMTIKN